MALDMFWGGAPQPINTPEEALAQLRLNEFALHEESDSDHDFWNTQTKQATPRDGERGKPPNEELKKRRVIGGLAAVSKRITADYDSDDARIIDLKQQSYSDEYVANKLREEGRTRYVGKTVGSRWLRLRKVLEERDDERLDDELSDWHVGEDEELRAIKEEVDKKFDLAFKRLKDKQWKEVSVYLAEKTNKRKYTAKACFERFTALIDGTALLPIELDDDQPGRRKLREARIAAAKARRAAAEQERKDIEAARLARNEVRKQEKIDAVNRRQQEMLRKEDERKERRRRKEEKKAEQVRARVARETYLEQMRVEREWEMEKVRVEKMIYKQITGKELFGKAAPRERSRRKRQQGVTMDWEEEEEDLDEIMDSASDADDDAGDIDRADSVANFEPKRKKKTVAKKRAQPVRKARAKEVTAKTHSVASTAEADDEEVSDAALEGEQGPVRATVTRETLLNPRSVLNSGELKVIICRRDIEPHWQEGETHAEVVARIAEFYESLKVDQLKELCKQAEVPPPRRKQDMIHALALADAELSFAGKELHLKSTDIEFMMSYEGYEGEFKKFLDEQIEEARARGEDVDDWE
ncbi:hypothetical protein Slin15195_G087120 [Septoria linicola]|uniref:DUF7626 domain-containing protein n=1 Tax=Septoria linicola TaxID=215465 RepID=A0A9Q9B0J0_9PEZI|nr:hypothetical protein Slin14017_G089710 [Septoria linicola]USW55393.1 hypothetical protein Slin15195_G087120 [Septoria linicola]